MRLYYWIRCKIGRPTTYRDYQDGGDWWYAMCRSCHRQSEVHGFGGAPPPWTLDDI